MVKQGMNDTIIYLIHNCRFVRNIFRVFSPLKAKRLDLYDSFLKEYVYSYYPATSIEEKRFFNIGAGNQRSKFNIWTYIDLDTKHYSQSGIDINYDLESLKPLPLQDNSAEVIFSSFVIEHISVDATKNLCTEAFRVLKKGGVYHIKVHCYDYSYKLFKRGLVTPKVPFECRESDDLITDFLRKYKGKVKAYFDESNNYVVSSIKNPEDRIVFTPGLAFLYHNADAAVDNICNMPEGADAVLNSIESDNPEQFYKIIRDKYIDQSKKQSYQHNADYFSKENLFKFIKNLGFTEVYFTQPYQSVSPALWEDELNNIHKGFVFSIEAIK
ncbi:MAG TPA: class I SAM-dependent methyltransferase [Bacteroidales bacterium]|nr:class I SAM-dependent methyltransferase [Bacteroidales bacterium]